MSWDDYVDSEVISSPGFWFLAAGAEIATMLGFKYQSSWGVGTMPIWTMLLVLLLIPVAAYMVTLHRMNR